MWAVTKMSDREIAIHAKYTKTLGKTILLKPSVQIVSAAMSGNLTLAIDMVDRQELNLVLATARTNISVCGKYC